nr:hypothetical protein RKHAN_01866 [Rhizobium sp. Khangiran2]
MEAAADAAVLGAFDESVRHLPQKNGTADPGRPVQNIRGVLHTPKPVGTINIGNGLTTTFTAAESELVLNRADLPTITFQVGDVIRGNDLPGTPLWEVKAVNSRYSSIITLALNLR